MRRTPRSRPIRPFLVALALVAAAPALADDHLGPFVPAQPWATGQVGGPGVQIQGNQIWIDRDGSDTQTAVDTFHPVPAGLGSGWTLRLSPSRTVMIALTSGGFACPGTPVSIRLYAIPAASGAAFTPLGIERTLARCLDQLGFSDQPTDSVRTAFFREAAHPTSGQARILWWDLRSGGSAFSQFPFDEDFGFVHFAPAGTMAWVQYELNSGSGTRYALVSLCPPELGQASLHGGAGPTGAHTATVETGTGGDSVVVVRAGSTVVPPSMAYTACNPSPAITGACCLPDGGCVAGATESACTTSLGGTWQGAGTSCSPSPCPAPPAPELTLSKSSPASVDRGGDLVYTLVARNVGTGPSYDVAVTDSIPLGMFFLAASNGGAYNPFTRTITWSLGTLNPGATAFRTLTVQAPCSGTQAVNGEYRITGTPGGTVVGSPVVTTNLTAPNTTALTIALSSQALATPPLRTGDRVRHTVQLTNTIAQPRQGVRFFFGGGVSSDVAAIVDSAGGTVGNFGGSLRWEGTVPASATVQIVWETQIRECRADTATVEVMNRGVFINLTNRCSQFLGFATPVQSFAVAPNPITLDLTSPTHGPVQEYTSFGPAATRFVLARPGATVDVRLRLRNSDVVAGPATELTFPFPYGFTPAMDPPFVGTPPAGTSWDPGGPTVTWSGVPGAGEDIEITVRGTLDPIACGPLLQASGNIGTCVGGLAKSLQIVGVAVPPPGAHLVALSPTDGLRTWTPGAPQWTPLLCGPFGNLRGIGRTPDGALWVVGTPSFRLDAAAPALTIVPAGAFGMSDPFDAAGDPRDSTLVVAGYQVGIGLRVRRYDPATAQVSHILNGALAVGSKVVVDTAGMIGVAYAEGLLRIDPANPSAHQTFTDAGFPGVGGLALEPTGDYLTGETYAAQRRLVGVAAASGAFGPLHDLDPDLAPGGQITGIATAPGLDVYVGDDQGGCVVVHRATGITVEALPSGVLIADLEFVAGGTGAVAPDDRPEGAGPLALAPARPNPAAARTAFAFTLPRAGDVALEVFDLSGRRVRTLARGAHGPGAHVVTWDGADGDGRPLGAGVYVVRLAFEREARRTKVVLAR